MNFIYCSTFNEDELLLSPPKSIFYPETNMEITTQNILHNDKVPLIKSPFIKFPYKFISELRATLKIHLNKDDNEFNEMWNFLSKLDIKYGNPSHNYCPIIRSSNYGDPDYIMPKLRWNIEKDIIYTKFFNSDNTKIDVKTIDDADEYFHKDREFRFIMSIPHLKTLEKFYEKDESIIYSTSIVLVIEQVHSI